MNDTPELPEEVIEALRAGRKIDAIKRLRGALGLDLNEAKAVADAWSSAHFPRAPAGRKVALFWPVFVVACLIAGGVAIKCLTPRGAGTVNVAGLDMKYNA